MFPMISIQNSSRGWESVSVSSHEAGPARTHFLWDLQPSQNLALDGPGEVTVLQNAHFKESHGRRGQEKAEKIWIVQPGKEKLQGDLTVT